jgi:hypothetical protein
MHDPVLKGGLLMMRRLAVGIMLLAVIGCAARPAQGPVPPAREAEELGFVPLFNGKDLTGLVVMGKKEQWVAENGVLKCLGGPGGWLRTEKEYTDFELRLEFKNTPKTNSGVFLHATEKGNPAFTGMEIQILDDAGNQTPGKGSTGAVYAAIAPAVVATKPPAEWNSYEITLKGTSLTVVLNGQKLYSVDLADPKLNEEVAKSAEAEFKARVAKAEKEGKKPPQEVEYKPFPQRAKTGFIGLQNHGHEIEFRNIRIKELK